MKENSYKSIRNAVIASIIAGIILAAIPFLRTITIDFLSLLWSGILWCWHVLTASYALPGWLWLFIFIFALIGLLSTWTVFKGEPENTEYKTYIEDNIYGLIWRWNWISNQISNLWCYCPTCNATLVYDDNSCRSSITPHHTDFICENCGHEVVGTIKGGNKNYALAAVEREIDRRIRNNEFQKH